MDELLTILIYYFGGQGEIAIAERLKKLRKTLREKK